MNAPQETIWVGPEPLRRVMRGDLSGRRRVDCADGGEHAGAGLFATGLHLVGLEALQENDLRLLLNGLPTEETVTGEAEKLTAKQERVLTQRFTIEKLSLAGNGRRTLTAMVSRLGIALGAEATEALLERVGHDPGRTVSVLTALSAGGFTAPTRRQVELLCGTSSESGLPWTLLDHVERRDWDAVAELLERLEAIPTIAFLAKRFTIAAYSSQHPEAELKDAVGALGDISEGAWRQARRIGNRYGAGACMRILEEIARADREAKRSRPAEGLAIATGAIARAANALPAN